MDMPLVLTIPEICLRLALTMIACAAIGYDRGAQGHAAGLRTTIMVGLAASVAMIQTNALLTLSGKTQESFAVMDLMRLPLGILTGVGFIGGGTILRRGDLVSGITTAATIWLVTVIGLCLGGGQFLLGILATGLGVLTLWGLRWVDAVIPREHHARLVVVDGNGSRTAAELPDALAPLGYGARFSACKRVDGGSEYSFELSWRRPARDAPPLDLLEVVGRRYAVASFALTTGEG